MDIPITYILLIGAKKMKENNLTRRNFILNTGKLIGAGAFVATLPQIFSACEKNEMVYLDPPPSNFYKLDLTPYPELLSPGGAKSIKIAGKNGGNSIFIAHHTDGTFSAMDQVCPHQGCTVGAPTDASGTLNCPCHVGNDYSTVDGKGVSGPFAKGLNLQLKQFETGFFDAAAKTLEIKV